ncbi:MAG TPA: efflux RND transporter permease subunit [Phycisphaerae bacterium]|nr:efflux RND transporter permease subunit [Phycisphaerae bacterium]
MRTNSQYVLLIASALIFATACRDASQPAAPVTSAAPTTIATATSQTAAQPPASITVTLTLQGASADAIDSAIARPLTTALLPIPNLTHIQTLCAPDRCSAILRFARNETSSAALQAVQTALAGLNAQLPAESSPPQLRPGEPAELPRLWLALASPTATPADLTAFARTHLEGPLARLPGVTNVELLGAADDVPTLTVDPAAMTADGLDAAQLLHALAGAPRTTASTAPPWQDTLIATRNGAPIHLSDIAKLSSEVHNTGLATLNDTPAIFLSITTSSGQPTTAQIHQILLDVAPALPPDTHLDLQADLAHDRALLIESDVPRGQSAEANADLLHRLARITHRLAPASACLAFSNPQLPARLNLLLINPDHARAAADLRNALGPAATLRVALIGDGTLAPPAIQLALVGPDPALLRQWAQAGKTRLESTADAPDLALFPSDDLPSLHLAIDGDAAAKLGVSTEDLSDLLALAFSSVPITAPDGRQVQVHLAGDQHLSPDALQALALPTASGQTVPLGALASLTAATEPAAILRIDNSRAILLTIFLPNGASPETIKSHALATFSAQHDALKLPAAYQAIPQ